MKFYTDTSVNGETLKTSDITRIKSKQLFVISIDVWQNSPKMLCSIKHLIEMKSLTLNGSWKIRMKRIKKDIKLKNSCN